MPKFAVYVKLNFIENMATAHTENQEFCEILY